MAKGAVQKAHGATKAAILLDVPIYLQPSGDTNRCVPYCLKMVIEYLNNHILDQKINGIEIEDITRIVKTIKGGTDPRDVRRLNKNRSVLDAEPTVEFSFRSCEFGGHIDVFFSDPRKWTDYKTYLKEKKQ